VNCLILSAAGLMWCGLRCRDLMPNATLWFLITDLEAAMTIDLI
jgi:hypothetical protein